MSDVLLSSAAGAERNPGGAFLIVEGDWEPWFAWHPVRLYSTGNFAWLRRIYRRCLIKGGFETCEYTDMPEQFPSYHLDQSGLR